MHGIAVNLMRSMTLSRRMLSGIAKRRQVFKLEVSIRSRSSFGKIRRFFPTRSQTIKFMVAEGNLVAAWTTYEGTQQGPLGPFPPSGRKAQFDFGAVFRIEGGKIAEWWVTWDNMTILRSLGHLPDG
jgi:predicted ester cyclase